MFSFDYYFFFSLLFISLYFLFIMFIFVYNVFSFFWFWSIYFFMGFDLFCVFFKYVCFSFFFDVFGFFFPCFVVLFLYNPSFFLVYFFSSVKEVFFSFFILSSQWFWSYSFLNYSYDSVLLNFSLFDFFLLSCSDSLLLPIFLPISLFLSSSDVMHTFTLFGSGVKLDCMPGSVLSFSVLFFNSGVFFGMCSELCGLGHSFMPIKVELMKGCLF